MVSENGYVYKLHTPDCPNAPAAPSEYEPDTDIGRTTEELGQIGANMERMFNGAPVAQETAGPTMYERLVKWCEHNGEIPPDDMDWDDVLEFAITVERAAASRVQGLEERLREIVADLRAHRIQGPSHITEPVSKALNHVADRIEAALTEDSHAQD